MNSFSAGKGRRAMSRARFTFAAVGILAAGCGTGASGRSSSAESIDPSADAASPAPGSSVLTNPDGGTSATQPDLPSGGPSAPDAGAQPVDTYCGNGRIDPDEECDPGSDYAPPACAYGCRAIDFLPKKDAPSAADPDTRSRAIGPAHPLAAASDGAFAVATIERSGGDTRVVVDAFRAGGRPLGASHVLASGAHAVDAANPSLAALPGGRYVAAWSDLGADGDDLGVALTVIDPAAPASASAPVRRLANTVAAGAQRDADVVFTGSEVAVAWIDDSSPTGPDLKVRTFDADLKPTSAELALAAGADDPSDVTLAPFAGSYAAAWRSSSDGVETVRVHAGASEWSLGVAASCPAEGRPAIVALDDSHLLVVYGDGVPSSGSESGPRLRAAVLDTRAAGSVVAFDVDPASAVSQDSPVLSRVGGAAYLAWHASGADGDANGEELFLKRIPFGAAAPQGSLTVDWSKASTPLPRGEAHRIGDQRFAALASTGTELISAWTDLGAAFGAGEWNDDVAMNVSAMPGERASDVASPVDATRYAARLQQLFCRHLADCCQVPTQFDYASCENGNTSAAVTAAAPLLGKGTIDVSRDGIDACVHATVDTACASLDADALHVMDVACGASIVGKISVGAHLCTDDVECAHGSYCAPADGAGVRSCVPWKQDGQTCDARTACTPLGPTYEYCADTGACARTKDVGEPCQTYSECSSGICDGQSSVCLATTPMADPGVPGGFCDAFTRKGAGTP